MEDCWLNYINKMNSIIQSLDRTDRVDSMCFLARIFIIHARDLRSDDDPGWTIRNRIPGILKLSLKIRKALISWFQPAKTKFGQDTTAKWFVKITTFISHRRILPHCNVWSHVKRAGGGVQQRVGDSVWRGWEVGGTLESSR